jgi:hypothetical protein
VDVTGLTVSEFPEGEVVTTGGTWGVIAGVGASDPPPPPQAVKVAIAIAGAMNKILNDFFIYENPKA